MIRLDITVSQAVRIYDGLDLLKSDYTRLAAETPSESMEALYEKIRLEIEALQEKINVSAEGRIDG